MTRAAQLLREPLLHFLLAGALVFAAYAWLHPAPASRDDAQRIELTQDDVRQIAAAWRAQGRPAPTPDELRHLVDGRVREELLHREALALGLDQGDAIVKRRLAQKMEFLFEDVSALREPSRAELEAWFAAHAQDFALPPRATFRHRYFSPDRRGERARDDAARALATLAGAPVDATAAGSVGDPFPFREYYGDRPLGEVASAFGPPFAQALFALAPGAWRGPIESGYGWHLVYVDSITPARTPALEEIEADVRSAWVEAQREDVRERALAAIRARYEVVLPRQLETVDLASVPAAGAGPGDGAP